MRYRKKPVEVEAMLFTNNVKEVNEFTEGEAKFNILDQTMEIETLEGVMKANVGDYIIKGVQGEFYPCKPDIFKETYEEVKLDNKLSDFFANGIESPFVGDKVK